MDEQMIENKNSDNKEKRFKQPQFHRSFVRLCEARDLDSGEIRDLGHPRRCVLELNQIGTGDRDVVAIAEAAKERERLQFFFLVSLRRTVDGYVNVEVSDTETRHGALH